MIMCSVDECTVHGLRGWAIDNAEPNRPVRLVFVVDGERVAELVCSALREDVAAAGFKSGHVGFAWPIPDRLIDGQPHRLEVWDATGRVTTLFRGAFVEDVPFTLEHPLRVHSWVDGLSHGVLRGWIVSARGERPLAGGRDILVMSGEERIGQVRADRYRGDVGRALACDPNCGFQFLPPPSHRSAHPKSFRFLLLPEQVELENSPYVTSFVADQMEATAIAVIDQIDRMHADLTRLRRQVRALLPEPGHTLADYDGWARAYLPALRARVLDAREHGAASDEGPLVSVIMPVWRPRPEHLRAAIASVLAQTWTNWELIAIDDAGADEAVSAVLREAALSDERVQVITRRTNGGISRATNDGIAAARGAWIAFFDHDDLLVDVAIEHMMAEARATDATLVYSDEDKVDQAGYFADPAFKTDWNYRLLLEVNYICHFVMVERASLDGAGALAPAKDGAQDHDLLLRLAEVVPAARIHHVPEILYHWRISETSTAASIGNKSYAIQAGVDAVSEHLARRGLPATVASRDAMTLYDIGWHFPAHPRVSIIIPFKDEVGTTRTCIERLLAHTDYPDWDIILVDNWSVTAEAQDLAASFASTGRVRQVQVREGFNYSRLNNLAVAETDAPFLMFLNNDVFVERPDWLRRAADELLADAGAAVVGGKFTYPNGTIQHAGVALGIGDVAGHVHVGIPAVEGGYGGRALFAQEMSAVTAAGMLVRATAFREVGGFDEASLAVAFNDIDLCLRIRARGWRVLWTPHFVAEHHESLSRGSDDRPAAERRFFHETQAMIERWGPLLRQDPFYSPHFALDRQPFFDLARPDADPGRYRPRVPPASDAVATPAAPVVTAPRAAGPARGTAAASEKGRRTAPCATAALAASARPPARRRARPAAT